MLKHLAERCHKTKAPSLAGTRASFHPHCAALAAFASLYQSGHTPTRSHPSYLHALAARLACGKGPPPEYLPRLNLTIGPRDRAFKRLRRRHRCMCPRLALVGFGWVMGFLDCLTKPVSPIGLRTVYEQGRILSLMPRRALAPSADVSGVIGLVISESQGQSLSTS